MTISWKDAQRDPSAEPNPLDWASFYVEDLKYGVGPAQLERADADEMIAQVEALLRDAGVNTMTGEELTRATTYYGATIADAFGVHRTIALSIFVDALMHGIALGAGLKGKHRSPRSLSGDEETPHA